MSFWADKPSQQYRDMKGNTINDLVLLVLFIHFKKDSKSIFNR